MRSVRSHEQLIMPRRREAKRSRLRRVIKDETERCIMSGHRICYRFNVGRVLTICIGCIQPVIIIDDGITRIIPVELSFRRKLREIIVRETGGIPPVSAKFILTKVMEWFCGITGTCRRTTKIGSIEVIARIHGAP